MRLGKRGSATKKRIPGRGGWIATLPMLAGSNRFSRTQKQQEVYPAESAEGVALFSEEGATRAPGIAAWEMMPSNPY